MIVRVRQWIVLRSARERWLLSVMAGLALALLLWLLVALPLASAYEDARERHALAVDRYGRIAARAAAIEGRTAAGPSDASRADLVLVVAEAASQSGLTLDSNAAQGRDTVNIVIAQARPNAVVQWLSSFEAQGIWVEELRMTPGASGTATLSARLVRSGA